MRDGGFVRGELTPALALGQDLKRQPVLDATTREQGSWIVAVTLLDNARVGALPEREATIEAAAALAVRMIGQPEIDRKLAYDRPLIPAAPAVAIIRLLIQRMEDAGALHLARVAIDALCATATLSPLDSARFLALQLRLAWKMGEVDRAQQGYEWLEEIGKRLGEPELTIRAWVGFSAVSQLKGNYPALREWSVRTVRLAEQNGYHRLAALGHHGLTVSAGMAGDFDGAIVHAWRHLSCVRGHSADEAAVHGHFGQILMDAGWHAQARAAFSRVITMDPPRRVLFPASGGLALASAHLGEVAAVRWVHAEVAAQIGRSALPYPLASALLECAMGLHIVGDLSASMDAGAAARVIANKYGYHEIVFKADGLADQVKKALATQQRKLSRDASTIIERLGAGPDLPEHLPFRVVGV